MTLAQIRFLLQVESKGMVYRSENQTFTDEMIGHGFLYGGPDRYYLSDCGRAYLKRLTEVPID